MERKGRARKLLAREASVELDYRTVLRMRRYFVESRLMSILFHTLDLHVLPQACVGHEGLVRSIARVASACRDR